MSSGAMPKPRSMPQRASTGGNEAERRGIGKCFGKYQGPALQRAPIPGIPSAVARKNHLPN